MVVERQNNEIIIRLSSSMNIDIVQKMLDYFDVMDIALQNKGTEEQAAELAREVNKKWVAENKHKFLP